MTEAPEEVAVKTVDPHETPTDDEGVKPSLEPSGMESLVSAPKEAVQHPSVQNGTKEVEQEPDVPVKEETESADSNLQDNSGGNDIVGEPVASTGDEGPKDSAAEIGTSEQSPETTTAPVDADGLEAVSVSEEHDEYNQTSVPAPPTTDKDLTNAREEERGAPATDEDFTNSREEEGGGIPAEDSSVPTQGEQEKTPDEIDSSTLIATRDEVPAQSVGSEPATTEEVVEEAPKSRDDSAEKSISEASDTVTPDKPTATPEPLSSEATVQDSDQAVPIPNADAEEPPAVTAYEEIPAAPETEEGGSAGDTAVVDKDLPESKGEAEDVHATDTGAWEEDETDRDRVEDPITAEESSTVGGTDPTAAAGTDDEGIKHEQTPPEDATVYSGTVAEDVKEEVADTENTVPQVEKETDSDTKVEESSSVVEPQETAPVESTKEDEETEREANKEELPAEAEPVGVEDKDLPEAGEQASEESSLEVTKDSEPSTLEEDPKHSTGILETVGDSVVSIGSSVLANGKALVGLGSSGTEKETGGEVPEDSTDSKSVDEVDITKPGDEEESADSKAVDETGTAETKPQEKENADESEQPAVAHAEKESPAVDEVPPNVTGSEEAQEHLVTSASKDSADQERGKESEEGASVPSEVHAVPSETEEVSREKPVDEPVVKAVDESQAAPTVLENLSSVTEAGTLEQSGSEGATERSFHVDVPHREAGKKLEESVSAPCTPGGTPLIRRVEQLEKKLAQFEDKQNSPKSQKSSASTPRSSVDRPTRLARHTLEETLSKGSLLDRVAALEKKLDHFFLVSGDHEVSPGTSVTEEGPATNQPESTENGTLEENAKGPLKPLKLDFDKVATPESAQRAAPPKEPVDSKPSANTEAVENVAERQSEGKSGAVQNLAESKTAEDSKPPEDVSDESYVKASEEPMAKKIAEDVKSPNPPSPTAEGEAQEPAAAGHKSSPAKKGKTGGPLSKLKAHVKGCFAKGGKKSAV